ncbi:hypothetical protein C8J56DRAFT_752899, partial [Mycena floridula]
DPDADLILRTTDEVDFHIQRIFLTLQSPVFATMFTLPQPKNESVPTIPFPRSAHDLNLLMGYCDPRNVPSTELEDMQCVLEMADQFEMYRILARVEKTLEKSGEFIEKEPFKVFVIAVQHRFETVARLTAKETLRFTMEERPFIPEMTRISGAAVHYLNQYYFACRKAVADHLVLSAYSWIPQDSGFRRPHCFPTVADGQGGSVRNWVVQHFVNARVVLRKRPCASIALKIPVTPNIGQQWQMQSCETCRSVVPKEFEILRQQFANEVEKAV